MDLQKLLAFIYQNNRASDSAEGMGKAFLPGIGPSV